MEKILEKVKLFIDQSKVNRPLIIAIDGVDGAGKSRFASSLTKYLKSSFQKRPIYQSSIDYFHNPRVIRHDLKKLPHVSFFENSFNYASLKEKLLDPVKFRSSSTMLLKHFDHVADDEVVVEEVSIQNNMILVFEGIFLHRESLAHFWDYSLFLEVPFEESYRRMSIRDGCSPDPKNEANQRYYLGQLLYLKTCNPRNIAKLVINNSDYQNPQIIF